MGCLPSWVIHNYLGWGNNKKIDCTNCQVCCTKIGLRDSEKGEITVEGAIRKGFLVQYGPGSMGRS